MQAKKTAEAEEHLRLAAKALKTGLLKWNPDYDSAGDEYSRAATAFKVAKLNDRALDALSKACECYKEIRSLYQAAKMLEQAVLLCRDMNKYDKLGGYAERGALLYRQHGSPESAAQLLEKAAKILEHKFPEEALSLYIKAAETVGTEDRPKEAANYLSLAGRMQVRAEIWDEAIDSIRQAIQLHQEAGSTATTGRLVCGLVLIHLTREDSIAAANCYREYGGYCDADQHRAVNTILNGFEEENADLVKEGLSSAAIKDLDIEFARLIRKIKLPDSAGLEAAAAQFGAQRVAAAVDASHLAEKMHPSQAHDEQTSLQDQVHHEQRLLEGSPPANESAGKHPINENLDTDDGDELC